MATRPIPQDPQGPQHGPAVLPFGTRAVTGGLLPWQLRQALELLVVRPGHNVVIAEVAEACSLSRGHFSKAFKRSLGQTPHRWLMARRIALAQELLGQPGISISEVALACGYADQSHLTRDFTAATGLSPGAWQRSHHRQVA